MCHESASDDAFAVGNVNAEAPPTRHGRWGEGAWFDHALSVLIRVGVFMCIALLVIGLIVLMIHGGGLGLPLNRILDPSSRVDTSSIPIAQVVIGDLRFDGLSIMLTGIIVLMAMPIAFVLFNAVRFIVAGEWAYAIASLITLINLLVAMVMLPLIMPR